MPRDMPPVSLNIVIISFGTRGDVQPHLEIAKVLRRKYGHRVRLVCAERFRSQIEAEGIEFYCNADVDPGELIRRRMLPLKELWKLIPTIRADFTQMSWRYWQACIGDTAAIPNGVHLEPFLADAIISIPQPAVHSWIAARLSIPLHMVGTNPRSPSRYMPHAEDTNAAAGKSQFLNILSWFIFDFRFLQVMKSDFNHFRLAIGLQTFTPLWYWSQWSRLRVPFSYIWSPNVVTKPKDWGKHIKIAGYVFRQNQNYEPPEDLKVFLASGEATIYVGFGSSWIPNSNVLFNNIFQAISESGVRAVVLQGTPELEPRQEKSDKIFIVRDCPHDWLFPQMSALIIHGGAGVTAMALKTGKPAIVCPVAGDMFFWASRVWEAGCGPEPLPVQDITPGKLVQRIIEVLQPEYTVAAADMAAKMASEESGAEVVARHAQETFSIYGRSGRCDILVHKPAAWRIVGIKSYIQLSAIAAYVLLQEGKLLRSQLEPLQLVKWPDLVSPGDPISGLLEGILKVAHLFLSVAKDFGRWYRQNSVRGYAGEAATTYSCNVKRFVAISTGLVYFLLYVLRVPITIIYYVSFGMYNFLDFICYQLGSRTTPDLFVSNPRLYSYPQMLLFLVQKPAKELNSFTISSLQWGLSPVRSLIALFNIPVGLLALTIRALDLRLDHLTCKQGATDIVAEAKEKYGRLEMQSLEHSNPAIAASLVRAVLHEWWVKTGS